MLNDELRKYMAECPLIAIIRGVKPEEVEGVANTLMEEGVRIIEIPLNSPEPFKSLEILSKTMEGKGLCGSGTVLTTDQVQQVKDSGGQIVVSPNCNLDVIKKTLDLGLVSLPGCLTPTEAFAAIDAGCDFVKMFPGGDLGPTYIKSLNAVIPKHIEMLTVGGVDHENMIDFYNAGSTGYGLGSNIYKAGDSLEAVRAKAKLLVEAASKLPK